MSIRLIDTQSLRMQMFTGTAIPKYAILSHTWDLDGEISFQEMVAAVSDPGHEARGTSGFDKVVKTCEEALLKGIPWAWVDSCCIDKTSSAELNEAINSMFEWYKNAEICLVHLADLHPSDDVATRLGKCRWFKRGWCLQELIAPSDLRFYDSAWREIGSKAGLRDAIGAITGVELEVLADRRWLSSIPVARRMSWASDRETTRPEDMAYCLLGIFSINMPMLYGEGKKAFVRLQHEIIRQSNDLTIFATVHGWTATASDVERRDLFAESPREFDSCWLLSSHRRYHVSFSLTNSGLFFPNARLFVSREFQCYFMDLQCAFDCYQDGDDDDDVRTQTDFVASASASRSSLIAERRAFAPSFKRMMLRKVGPGLFVRLHGRSPRFEGQDEMYPGRDGVRTKREDIYVRLAARHQDDENAAFAPASYFDDHQDSGTGGAGSMQIASGSLSLLGALQDPSPSEFWDAATSRFLTEGEEEFKGCIRLYSALVEGLEGLSEGGEAGEYFYILCGRRKYGGNTPYSSYLSWAKLLSPATWEMLQRRYGEMAIDAAAEVQDGGDVSFASVAVDGNKVNVSFLG